MSYYDEFDDPRFVRGMEKVVNTMGLRESIRARGPLLGGLTVVALVSVLVGVVFYSYPREAENQELAAVPIIRADAGDIKVLPQDPGGMNIPYRDSTVFETLASRKTDSAGRIENLLADSEEPLEREQIFAGLKTELHVNGDNELSLTIEVPHKQVVTQDEILTAPAPVIVASATTAIPSSEKVSTPTPQAKPSKVSPRSVDTVLSEIMPAAGDATRPVMAQGSHMVQLGSLRSDEAVRSEWKRLQGQFPSALSALDLRVQKVDLGSRGVYHRIQAGPVAEAQARSICSSMEAKRPGGCLVIKR